MSVISSLDRALDILNIMYDNGGKISVSELSKIMGLHRSTVYRTLNTLYQKDFLQKDNKTSLYSLGTRVLTMGLVAATNMPLAKIAKPHLSYLSNKYEVNASILIIEGKEKDKSCVFCLNQFLDASSTTLLSTPSQCDTNDAYRPATGLCFVAYNVKGEFTIHNEGLISNWQKINRKFNKSNYNIQSFIKELEEVKKQGYALEDEAFLKGQIAVASPIFNNSGEAIATLGIDGDKKKLLNKFKINEVIDDIIKHASIINEAWAEFNN